MDTVVSEEKQEKEQDGEKKVKTIVISSPVTGKAADLSTAPDEAFAGKMMATRGRNAWKTRLCGRRRTEKYVLFSIPGMR